MNTTTTARPIVAQLDVRLEKIDPKTLDVIEVKHFASHETLKIDAMVNAWIDAGYMPLQGTRC